MVVLQAGILRKLVAEKLNLSNRSHYKIEDLMAEMPDQLPMVDGWDELVPAGKEVC